MSAIPVGDPDLPTRPVQLKGERPNPMDPPAGCCFHTRCPYAVERCRSETPALAEIDPGHWTACHRSAELTLKGALEFGAAGN